jgi:transcriptional regulator with XRE-family HTH domain
MQDTKTDRPFPEALGELMDEQGIGVNELARATRRHGWGSAMAISTMKRGLLPPTTDGMEAIARVLGVKPEVFAEYRAEQIRKSLDYRHVPFRKMLKVLRRIEG